MLASLTETVRCQLELGSQLLEKFFQYCNHRRGLLDLASELLGVEVRA